MNKIIIYLLILFPFFNLVITMEPNLDEKKSDIIKVNENLTADSINNEDTNNLENQNRSNYCKKITDAISPRALAKTVTYRITGTLTTVAIAYALSSDIEKSLAMGSIELVLKPFIYYVHERVWGCIPWRRNQS